MKITGLSSSRLKITVKASKTHGIQIDAVKVTGAPVKCKFYTVGKRLVVLRIYIANSISVIATWKQETPNI